METPSVVTTSDALSAPVDVDVGASGVGASIESSERPILSWLRDKEEVRMFMRELLWHLLLTVQFACTLYCVRTYGFDLLTCVGPSMAPSMEPAGDLLLVVRTKRYKRGDVVVGANPAKIGSLICKRIIGMPHDQVVVRTYDGDRIMQVPSGHVWLQGDNLEQSIDSRKYGFVPIDLLQGRVAAKLWPSLTWVPNTLEYSEQPGYKRRPLATSPYLESSALYLHSHSNQEHGTCWVMNTRIGKQPSITINRLSDSDNAFGGPVING